MFQNSTQKLSMIIPTFNEAESLEELNRKIIQVLLDLSFDYEIIYIDDGSTDKSFNILNKLREKNNKIKIIQFRKNFGKSASLSAGFNEATGELIITMDADMQDDPSEIPNLLNKINEGYDLVSGWKQNRKDPMLKIISSKIFNFTVALLTGIKLHDFNCGFKIYRQEVVKNLDIYGEMHRFLPVLADQQGFKIGELKIKHNARKYGKSKYGKWGMRRLKNYLLDPINIILLTKYKARPAHFFGNIGLLLFFIGFIICSYLTVLWFFGQGPIGNRPLLFLGILLIIISIQLISMGFLGEIITKQNHQKNENYYIKTKK